jgi:hypothetical protein
MQTHRFGVRPFDGAAVPRCFEVFDRVTGAAVAPGMRRAEAESEGTGRRDHRILEDLYALFASWERGDTG